MKRRMIYIFFLSIILVSCKNFYIKSEDLTKIKSKTSMNPFTHLNDPIVPLFAVFDQYSLFGNSNLPSYYNSCGEIFVVYDWENEEVYDWAYCDGIAGSWYSRASEIGTPVKYYAAGDGEPIVGELSPETGKITQISTSVKGHFISLNNNSNPRSKYGLIDGPGVLDSGYSSFGFYIFDSERKKINSNGICRTVSHIGYLLFPIADPSGNFWFAYDFDNKNNLIEINCEDGIVSKEVVISNVNESNEFESLDVRLVTDDYVYLSGAIHQQYNQYLYIYNKKSGEIQKIIIPRDNEGKTRNIYMGFEINGQPYALTNASEAYVIYKIDVANLTMTEVFRFDEFFMETVYVRDSRLYLLTTPGRSFSVFYIDFAFEKPTMSDVKTFTFEDIVKL